MSTWREEIDKRIKAMEEHSRKRRVWAEQNQCPKCQRKAALSRDRDGHPWCRYCGWGEQMKLEPQA